MPGSGIRKGDVLKDRYEIQRLIGKGGMSRVYLAADLQLNNKLWAVKEVDRTARDPAGRPMEYVLVEEARMLSRLDHPKIVSVVDIEKTDEYIYVVMDYVEGETLANVVKRLGPQSEQDVCSWMLQLCDVLDYLHNQEPPIVYRDLKPSNVILHPDGYVKLIDFGVVREYKDNSLTSQDTIAFGTRGYAPPEQYGKSQTDPRADIYALGATMWHLLAGKAPAAEFPLRDVREENPQVGEGFAETIIPKCTKLDREERYISCKQLAGDLSRYKVLTRDYRRKQTAKLHKFQGAVCASVACAIMGCGLLLAHHAAVTQQYETQLEFGNQLAQTEPEVAQQHYRDAIAINPAGIDAYEGLISCYKADGVFTIDEKRQFDQVYLVHLDHLRALERFSELSFEIGRLYWGYYEYGQQGTTFDPEVARNNRIRASAEYFKAAASDPSFELRDRAAVYSGIAHFVLNAPSAIREGDDDEDFYSTHWENLIELTDGLMHESNDVLRLESVEVVASSIETYADKFKRVVGVGKEELVALERKLEDSCADPITSSPELELRRQALLKRMSADLPRKIESVYLER